MRRWLVVLACSLIAITAVATVTGGSVLGVAERENERLEVQGVETTTLGSTDGLRSATGSIDSKSTFRHCHTGPTETTRERASEIAAGDEPRFVTLHPNPTTADNVGEFFVLKFPTETHLKNWTVTDGHTTASLPNETVTGRVAFSLDQETTGTMTSYPVLELEGHLRLAADGDELGLYEDGELVDAVDYDRAPTAEIWYRDEGGGGVWWPKGATCLPPTTGDTEEATAFVLPDSPAVPLEALSEADDRILLAGYTFASEDVTRELIAAHDRGVDVEVLLEAGPVGGTPAATRPYLDDLVDAGITVQVLGGEGARYTYHHPKYAVVDDGVLVLTENWKPSGVGGASSRGWGVHLEDEEIADDLAAVFEADFAGRDTTAWEHHREKATFVEEDSRKTTFSERIEPETVPLEGVELLLAPDNAEDRVGDLLGSAEESILIKQVRIGDEEFPLLTEALEAARRGVEVQILLDATWYVESENRELADALQRTAEEERLPLEVRLVDDGDRFEKIHAKGVVIDGETAIVGSANWNENAFRNNREVLLVLHGEEVGAYYADVFDADWEGESWPVPLEFAGIVALGLVATGLLGRRYVDLEDVDTDRERPPPRVVPTINDYPAPTLSRAWRRHREGPPSASTIHTTSRASVITSRARANAGTPSTTTRPIRSSPASERERSTSVRSSIQRVTRTRRPPAGRSVHTFVRATAPTSASGVASRKNASPTMTNGRCSRNTTSPMHTAVRLSHTRSRSTSVGGVTPRSTTPGPGSPTTLHQIPRRSRHSRGGEVVNSSNWGSSRRRSVERSRTSRKG